LMRTLLAGFGTVFVERFDVQKSAEHADELVDAARAGTSLILFPEGTLQRHTGLAPFRSGAFQVAAKAGVPVVPVAPEGEDFNAAMKLRDKVRAEILKHCGEPDLQR